MSRLVSETDGPINWMVDADSFGMQCRCIHRPRDHKATGCANYRSGTLLTGAYEQCLCPWVWEDR